MRPLAIFSSAILLSTPCNAQVWPISNTTNENADVVTSVFGPRMNGDKYQIHYGIDVRAANGTTFYSIESGWVFNVDDEGHGDIGKCVYVEDDVTGDVFAYWHLSEITVQEDDYVVRGQALGKTGGSGAAVTSAHLHLGYYPYAGHETERPDERKNSDNSMRVLPHRTSNPYQIRYPHFSPAYEDNDHVVYPPSVRFEVYVDRKRIDINRIEVDVVDATNVDGYYVLSSTLLREQWRLTEAPGAGFSSNQESGVIDLSRRIGYDFGPRGTNQWGLDENGRLYQSGLMTWNGVRITPAEYSNSDAYGNHIYYVDFFFDEAALRRLRGGINWLTLRVKNFDETSIAEKSLNIRVYWPEEWPYDTYNASYPSIIEVGPGGTIIVKNQNNTETTHPIFNREMIIMSGGRLVLEGGSDNAHRTWFGVDPGSSSGGYNLWVQSGGELLLGNYARLVNHGAMRLDGQPSLGTDAKIIGSPPTDICTNCPPPAPKNFAVDIVGNDVILTWDPASENTWGLKAYINQEARSIASTTRAYAFINSVSSLPADFKVGAFNENGESISQAITLLNITGPAIISPTSEATGVPTSPKLTWGIVSQAVSYIVRWSTNPDFTNATSTTVASASHSPVGLANSTTYYWQVNAFNGEGTTDWSEVGSFATVSASLPTPTATAATNIISTSFTANWNPVAGATSYHLDVGASSTFDPPLRYDNIDVGNVTSRAVTDLNPGTTYHYRVRAYSPESSNSNTIDVTTAPSPQTLLSPTHGATDVSTSPKLVWNSLNGATSYTVRWRNSVGAADSAITADTSHTASGLGYSLMYTWSVTAWNAGVGHTSGAWEFTTIAAPLSAPILVLPSDTATNVSTSPTLQWNASAGATSYRLQLATDTSFAALTLDDSTMTVTSRQVGPLVNYTTYYWKVGAKNAGSPWVWSSRWSFTTLIAQPTLASPANGATNVSRSAKLIWNSFNGATSYTVRWRSSVGVADSAITADSSHTASGLGYSMMYTWSVNAWNAGVGHTSAAWEFTTIAAPLSAPILVLPSNTAINVSTSPTLQWNASTGATNYRLQLATDTSFAAPTLDDSTITATSQPIRYSSRSSQSA